MLQVGSGKSSLLTALLGELQPLETSLLPLQQPGTGPIAYGPVMNGTVAYCCQVPWVDAGTIRVSKSVFLLGSKTFGSCVSGKGECKVGQDNARV